MTDPFPSFAASAEAAGTRLLVPAAPPQDLRTAASAGVNVLLIGSAARVERLLDTIAPALTKPVTRWRPGVPLELPAGRERGTLILRDVTAMSCDDQRRLFDWLTAVSRTIRVVTTARYSLLPHVREGRFLPDLYYRLNIVCVEA